jgi:LPXTG-site transpeptidase (sortase) family protein
MFKKFCLCLILISLYLFSCNYIYRNTTKKIITNNIIAISKPQETPIGKLTITKIGLDNNLYNIKSSHNNIEENVTILKVDSNIIILAAHSGIGRIAYFNNLNKLTINDEIKLLYQNHNYLYKVISIWEEDKNGYIHINKENNKQLVLTTCSPNHSNKQLIINSILKESN